MFKVHPHPQKGLSILATTAIPPGTRLLAEAPLISLPSPASPSNLFRYARFKLSNGERAILGDLSANPVKKSAVMGWGEAGWAGVRTVVGGEEGGDERVVIGGEEGSRKGDVDVLGFWETMMRFPGWLDVWRNNNFLIDVPAPAPAPSYSSSLLRSSGEKRSRKKKVVTTFSSDGEMERIEGDPSPDPHLDDEKISTSDPKTREIQAIFNRISRFNHACVPNAQANWNSRLGEFTVHTIQPISAGEEIHLSYLRAEGMLGRDARREKLNRGYGFVCQCEACAGRTWRDGETRRKDWRRLLRDVNKGIGQGDFRGEEELELTVDFGRLYEDEGIRGREAATVWLKAAELAGELRDRRKVLECAEKGLRLDKECLGDDNPAFHSSLERMRRIEAA